VTGAQVTLASSATGHLQLIALLFARLIFNAVLLQEKCLWTAGNIALV
jgi:hypothetical protein